MVTPVGVARGSTDATSLRTQGPAGGADKSLGRNRTGGLCANVHWVGNGFPAARSLTIAVAGREKHRRRGSRQRTGSRSGTFLRLSAEGPPPGDHHVASGPWSRTRDGRRPAGHRHVGLARSRG